MQKPFMMYPFIWLANASTPLFCKLQLNAGTLPDLTHWKNFLGKLKNPIHEVQIALVGKYNELADAYKSIYESFYSCRSRERMQGEGGTDPLEEALDEDPAEVAERLRGFHGVLVAPGFGERGIEAN